MTYNNVQTYFTYEENKDEEVEVAFHDHIVNDTVKVHWNTQPCALYNTKVYKQYYKSTENYVPNIYASWLGKWGNRSTSFTYSKNK